MTPIDTSVSGATLRLVDPFTVPSVAVIVEFPLATAVASPPFVIVATPVVPDDHWTWVVRFAVVLLLYVPVAVNCSVAPMATDGSDRRHCDRKKRRRAGRYRQISPMPPRSPSHGPPESCRSHRRPPQCYSSAWSPLPLPGPHSECRWWRCFG